MRSAIILATALALLCAADAQAQIWCGQRADATIQCSYSNRAECEKAIGRGAMCFINKADAPRSPVPTLPPTVTPPRGTDVPTFTPGR
jgi:hypothetical protein